MRVLLQRVSSASVSVDGDIVGAIETGYLLLIGVTHGDTRDNARWLANKVAGLRLFADEQGKMNLSLADVGGSVLVISQFTLYGNARKGRRPSFTDAAPPEVAEPLIDLFSDRLRQFGLTLETGVFGAMMEISLVNDGPVTLMLEH